MSHYMLSRQYAVAITDFHKSPRADLFVIDDDDDSIWFGLMRRHVLIEEIHLTLCVPRNLREAEYRAIRRTLTGRRFRAALGRAVEEVVRRYRP